MVDSINNIVDLSFLDLKDEKIKYSVLILLNRPIIKDYYLKLRELSNFIICADGAANRLYDITKLDKIKEKDKIIPNCIVGDFDSIRPEVQEFFTLNNVKMFMKQDQDTTDLEKCLYVSLEKISEISVDEDQDNFNSTYKIYNSNNSSCEIDCFKKYSKKCSIIILGAQGGRIDHTFSSYSQVYKYLNMYFNDFGDTEILMMSKSSCSVYLKPGKNIIYLSKIWEKKNQGYSVIPLFGEGKLKIYEDEEIEKNKIEKNLKFGDSFYFKKGHNAQILFIHLDYKEDINSAFIFTFTTIYHDYN